MGIGFIRTVIALLLLSLTLMGCGGKANGGGTIIGNPKFPVGPAAPRQETPGNDQEKKKDKDPTQDPTQQEEEPPPPSQTKIVLELGSWVPLILRSSKWILVPPGLPPGHGGLMRSPIKILVVLDDSLFWVEDED